jgi:hypothetical protein
MPDVNKNRGGKATSPVTKPIKSGTPKAGGYDSAPRSEQFTHTQKTHGHGGSGKGAH